MNSSLRRVRIWSASLLKTAGKLQQGHELRERRANAPGKRVIRKKTIKKYVGECYHHYDFVIINHRGGDCEGTRNIEVGTRNIKLTTLDKGRQRLILARRKRDK